ncbi:MAG: ATP-dependent DNA helicase RecG [Akkermansia sp.]|nr:ATP-dependent DNA helicase RecG [Akkermansia sp.]
MSNRRLQPDTPLAELADIAPRELQALHAAGLEQVQHLLRRLPRRYEDRRSSAPLHLLQDGEAVSLRVHVYGTAWRFAHKRYFEAMTGTPDDPHGTRLYLRWFNMPYVAKLLATGMNLSVFGKVRLYGGKLTMANPDFEVMDDEDAGRRLVEAALGGTLMPLVERKDAEVIHTGRIVPIYRAIPGIAVRNYRCIVWKVLQQLAQDAPAPGYDVAPAYPYWQAVRDIHFPAEEAVHRKARLRFALVECFEQQFRVAWRRQRLQGRPGQITATSAAYMEELLQELPFELTSAQRRCVQEIRTDMASPRQMNRLLQGDVGSGKTLVALCAMLLAVGSGKNAALLAPTQILAEQHYRNFCRLLQHMDVPVSLRTSDHADDTGLILDAGGYGDAPRIIVGTHALLYKKNRPANLGLAVIDEQHKFGVEQREQFIASGDNPDVLVMTATPIPRTLTLTLYGDLDVSIIDELPANRGEIVTALRNPANMKRIISFMSEQMDAGRQIYIVSPLVEESDTRKQSSATSELGRWKAVFPERRIGLLHGRMNAEEKESAMQAFHRGEMDILVATTVVEVGVDVTNANIMIINNADTFGLSQLHQLRGRIGRGEHKSFCILLSSAKPGEPGREKLEVLCRTLNGFEIAEEDFRMRGPGDVLGTAQSGLGRVEFPEWLADMRLIHRASRDAAAILSQDPELNLPVHVPLRRLVQGMDNAGMTC